MCRLFYVIIVIELRIERAAFLFGENYGSEILEAKAAPPNSN